MFFPHRGFMALTELPHHRWGQCQVQRPSTESPWCALGTSPSPWPPCRPKCPLPLFCGCVHPTASATFLFPFLITTAWETPPHSLFGAQKTSPLRCQPHPGLVTPCWGSWVFCSWGVRLFACLFPQLSRISMRLSHTHSWKKLGAK